MNSSRPFKSVRRVSSCLTVLLGMLALALPITAHSMIAGKTAFVIGKVEAITADGNRRALSKGSEINTGETISTEAGARAQIRFNDGGFISLQPNSLFRVDEFNYQNKTDGEEKGFFSLLKGGLRAITGAIGRVNRDSYRLATPVATIGVRGTGYSAELSEGLFVNVGEGAISLTNNAGLLVVSSGNAAYVATLNTLPAFTTRQPRNPPARLYPMRQLRQNMAANTPGTVESVALVPYTEADRRNPDGSLTIAPDLVAGLAYDMAYAYSDCPTPCVSAVDRATGVVPTFSGGALIGYVSPTVIGAVGTGLISLNGTDGIISWGRWTGPEIAPTGPLATPSVNPGVFDYVVGVPTANMPLGGTFTYSLISGTPPPTASDGTPWVLSGNLSANFSTSKVDVNLTVGSTVGSYGISTPVTIKGATFSSGTTGVGVTGTGPLCQTACTATVNGFFAGDNAGRAGLSYGIKDPSALAPRTVQGVAAFAQVTTPPALVQPPAF